MAVKSLCILIALIVNISVANSSYTFPNIKIRQLAPRGFQVSIPHSSGVQLFGFHGNINKKLASDTDVGQYSGKVTSKSANNMWSYTNSEAVLNPKDKLYFRMYVIVDGKKYEKLNQQYTAGKEVEE